MSETETDRLADLRSYGVLDTPAEARFDGLTALAADLFETPMAVISLIDHDRQWFKSVLGIAPGQTPRQEAFCDHTIRLGAGEVMVVPDARADPASGTIPRSWARPTSASMPERFCTRRTAMVWAPCA